MVSRASTSHFQDMQSHPRGVVLHVEDDVDARESMAAVLGLSGFEVHTADSAGAALSRARELGVSLDVLVVDYHLGQGTTGTEVAESIGRQVGYGIPTLLVTGDLANAEIPLLPNAPVWLLRKPAPLDMLVATLPALVEFRRAVRHFVNKG
jgi:two-component system, sensor histidine kinase